ITTSQIIDYAATYNVRDATTGEVVGALRRKGLKSHLWRDEWAIISKEGSEIGVVTETNNLLTRFIGFIPQKYDVLIYNCEVAKIKQHFNPFVLKYTMTILDESAVDPRLLIVAGILLAAIEGRQT
ncbi:MAG: hypothetical protein SVM80_06895, partial [Halobacteriota archaeon]|nr:hypothetical protein [Halobacteriota archaeon]